MKRNVGKNRGAHGRSLHHSPATVSLAQAPLGRELLVVSLNRGYGMQLRLRNLGLAEGTRIRKVSNVALGGPVVIQVHRTQVAIGRGMARHVLVRPV